MFLVNASMSVDGWMVMGGVKSVNVSQMWLEHHPKTFELFAG
jgi:hypothetical protein